MYTELRVIVPKTLERNGHQLKNLILVKKFFHLGGKDPKFTQLARVPTGKQILYSILI